jgi:hypothetical protein
MTRPEQQQAARPLPPPWKMTEAELLAEILGRCEGRDLWDIRIAPERIPQRLAANRGFPDLAIFGPAAVIYRELKTCKGRDSVSRSQTTWKHRLRSSGQNWDIWTPLDLENGHIDDYLRWLETPGRRTDAFSLTMARPDA